MMQNTNIDKLFIDTLIESQIKHVFVDGFSKYIVYNKQGTLFVIGYNATTKKYGFGRAPLMTNKYNTAQIPLAGKPDYKQLYDRTACMYKKQEQLITEFRDVLDYLANLCAMLGMDREK